MPLHLNAWQTGIRDAIPVLARLAGDTAPVLTLNRWVYYFTDHWVDRNITNTTARELLAKAAPGTLFAWDRRFCPEPIPDLSFAEMSAQPGWVQVWPEPAHPQSDPPYLVVFERQGGLQVSKRVGP